MAECQIQIQSTADYYTDSSTLPALPILELVEVQYKLKALTYTVMRGHKWETHYHDENRPVFESALSFPNHPILWGKAFDAGLVDLESGGLRNLTFDTIVIPPFVSHNIARRYDIEILVSFICAGKRLAAGSKWENVRVVYNEDCYRGAGLRLYQGLCD